MFNTGRSALHRGFSIVEAIIALGLVLLAIVGVFDIMPFTYKTIDDDSIRSESATAAHRYLDDIRVAIQSGLPIPGPTTEPLAEGASMATGQASQSTPTVALTPSCTQPEGPTSPLFDCKVSVVVTIGDDTHVLSPVETLITRQLP